MGAVAGWGREVGFLLCTQICLCVFTLISNQMGTIQTIFFNTNQLRTETVLIKKERRINNVSQTNKGKLTQAIYGIKTLSMT